MKHKLFLRRFFASLLLLAVSTLSWSHSFEVDGIYYNITDGNSVAVTFKDNASIYSGTVVIPSSVEYNEHNYTVTSIGEWAFDGCSGLTSITIPNSVTSIGEWAFCDCSGLTSITIPNSVTSIGDAAFAYCSGLTSVIINSNAILSKTYSTSNNLRNIFGKQVKEYIIGESVTSIGEWAFVGCSGLTSVTIGNSVTSIGDAAFQDCDGLTSITIPNSVTTLGESAFYRCSGLTSVTIGNSVTSIGDAAFAYCSGLTKAEFASIESLCGMTFSGYGSSNPLSIAKHLYVGGKEVTNLVIPEGVTSIGAYAFVNCADITSVTLPKSLTTIASGAFSGCSSIQEINVPQGSLSLAKKIPYAKNPSIREVDGDMVLSEVYTGLPSNFSTIYDCDGDGVMDFLGYIDATKNIFGYFNKQGELVKELGYSDGIPVTTPINGNGDLVRCTKYGWATGDNINVKNVSMIADVDNDGRMDLVMSPSTTNSSFLIYIQQADGTFLPVEQSVTQDAAEAEAAAKRKGSGGVVSFAFGMMVKAREAIRNGDEEGFEARNVVSEPAPVGAVSVGTNYRALDMNDDGINDIFASGNGQVWYSYDDNRWFYNSKRGNLYPCDLNGDSELDYVCFDGSAITLQTRTAGNAFEEKTLFENSKVKQIAYKDFDNDGDIDILAYINDGSSTYFVFFRNDGDLSFKRRERNFAVNYTLYDIKDVDADGLYEMLVYDNTNKCLKLLRIDSKLAVTEDEIDMSDGSVGSSAPVAMGDFDNDGKVGCRYCSNSIGYSKFINLSDNVNSAPNKMPAPTAVLNAESQRLRINWALGEDTETSACDLTYELRIGTTPGSGDVLFGAALADGRRRTLDEGNMGRSLSTLFNARSMKPGKYYISVQAVDGGGRGGAWSDDFVYEHQLSNPVIVSNFTQQMATADTLRLSVKAPIDGAEYKWTVSNGRQIESDGSATCFVFEHDGKQTVNLAMTYDGRTLNAEPIELEVTPAKRVSYNDPGYVDFNQDGYPEYLGYVNDGKGNLEKVLLSYATQYSGSGNGRILDFNMDGYPDVIYSSSKVLINLGEQDNDFDVTTETVNLSNTTYGANTWFDANNDGNLDNTSGYNDGTNLAWSKYATGSPNYDVNRDGMLDIITKNGNKFYVSYKEPTASMDYTSPQMMYDEAKSYWQLEDINNDGYVDIVYYDYNPKNLTIVKGGPTLPYKETIVYDLPVQSSSISIHDYNNDGYLDICIGSSGLMEFGQDFSMEFKILNKSDVPYSGYFMVQEDGGYPCSEGRYESYIKNLPPSAPASVAAKQTKDGMLITWSDAEDDHTPAMQMRYNVSVKRKGKKGDNSFVISPMNGLIDKAAICGNIMYKKSTQMLVPASVLTAGETYEIQVQAIDLWNQHSPMTKAIEFTMMSNGYIDVAEQVATNKETTVKFVGTQAGSYTLNAGDGATIVSNKGIGEFIVKWATAGVKNITLTAGGTTVKSSVTVVNPINLAFTVPASVFAKAPLTVEVSDEMAKAAKNVGIRCNDSRVKVEYVTGSKTASVTFPATGTYTLEAYSTDEVKGNTYSKAVNVTAEMPKAVIKQVDVDGTTGSYAINWNASALPAGISKVVVSKEGSKLGEFSEIGTVDAASGVYVDKSSNASVMASRYSIRLLANNGQESDESVAHRPLHVMIVKGIAGFNLIWDEYEGLDVQSYDIMRGSTPSNLQKIAQVAGSINSYSDLTAPSGVSYYAINLNTVPSQKADSGLLYANANEPVGSNVISTANALDVVPANSVEIIVLDEDNTLSDEHRDLQLYHMILPTYTTVSKVAWEITEGSEMATINANGLLHAKGGNGTVVATVRTLDGSDLSAQISISINASKETGIREVTVDAQDETVTLTEVRYYTLDGHRLDAPVAGKVCLEWSIYSNGQIKTRKILK